jgi:acetate kinase
MGFTPLEGIVMATRSGSVDPGLVLWLIRQAGLDAADVQDALERRSGLLGLCGSGDMRVVLQRAGDHDASAELALAVYSHRLRGSIAAMAASLGGIDAVVFTGGAGERAPRLRLAALEGLAFLGVELDEARNARATGELELDVSTPAAACRAVVVRAREDVEIAGQVRAISAGA